MKAFSQIQKTVDICLLPIDRSEFCSWKFSKGERKAFERKEGKEVEWEIWMCEKKTRGRKRRQRMKDRYVSEGIYR